MKWGYIEQQPPPSFNDGLPAQTIRAYRLPDSNLTVTVMVSPDMQPSVGIAMAGPGEFDAQLEGMKGLCNALDNARYADKPGRKLTIPAPSITLTDRERRVARALCAGQCKKQIAEQLGVSLNTVFGDVSQIRNKVGAKTNEQAIYLLSFSLLANDIALVERTAEALPA